MQERSVKGCRTYVHELCAQYIDYYFQYPHKLVQFFFTVTKLVSLVGNAVILRENQQVEADG